METLLKFFGECLLIPLKERFSKLSDKMKFILSEIAIIIVTVIGTLAISNFIVNKSLNDFDKMKSEIHENGTSQRMDTQTNVYNSLNQLIAETGAKRACVIEMHNGVNNPSGLPYLYGEMTYEQPAKGQSFIADQFQKVTLSTYKLALYIHTNYEYCGPTEDISDKDSKLYEYLKGTDVKFIGVVALHNNKCEIGFLILTFNKQLSKEEQRATLIDMAKYSSYITTDLTMGK